MRVAVNSHALPIYKKNRIASLLCIFETTVIVFTDNVCKQFESRSVKTFLWACSGFKLFDCDNNVVVKKAVSSWLYTSEHSRMYIRWAMTRTNQTAVCSLISAFVISYLECIVVNLAPCKISIFQLVSVVEQTDLDLTKAETQKTGFRRLRPRY